MDKLTISIYRKPKWDWYDFVGFSGARDGAYPGTYGWSKTGYAQASGSNRSVGARLIRSGGVLESGTAFTDQSINGQYLQFTNLTQNGDKVQIKYNPERIIRFWYRYAGINQILFDLNDCINLTEISLRRNNIAFGNLDLGNLQKLQVFDISRNVSITSLILHPQAPLKLFYLDNTSVSQQAIDAVIMQAYNRGLTGGTIMNNNIMPSQHLCDECEYLVTNMGWSITTRPICVSNTPNLAWRGIDPYCEIENTPPVIGVLSLTQPNDYTAILSWSAATDDKGIQTYEIWAYNADWGGYMLMATVSGSTLTYTFNDMDTGTYTFIVRAKDTDNAYSQNSNSVTTSFTVAPNPPGGGDTNFTFDADFMVVTYTFTDGMDLDTRTGVLGIGQVDYVGYGQLERFPASNAIIEWGGDNQGLGVESCLIDLKKYKAAYPSKTSITADLRGLWWVTKGTNINIDAKLYKGGTMVEQGPNGSPAYGFTNNGYTDTLNIVSQSKTISAFANQSGAFATHDGDRIAVLNYNFTTGEGSFNINDTTTPKL